MKIHHWLWAVFAALGGGLCVYTSFAPLGWWPAAFPGIALLIIALEGRSWLASFGLGFVFGMAYFLFLFHWAYIAAGIVLAQVALTAVEALYLAVLAVIWQGLLRGRITGQVVWVRALVLALSWVAMEQLRSSWPLGGMPWGALAYGQVNGPLLRLAPWGSTQLVALLVISIGVLLHWAIFRGTAGRHVTATASLLAAAALMITPAFLPLSARAESYVTVGFVQGEIPDESRLPEGVSRALTVTQNLVTESAEIADGGAEIVLWPESASDRDIRSDPDARRLMLQASSSVGVPILLGTQRYPEDYRYNDYVVWMPNGEIADSYTKQHPIPFGEYIPGRKVFRSITSAVDRVSVDMRAGTEPAYVDVDLSAGKVRIAVPICFEVAVTPTVSEAVDNGAQLIVVPTNNASFGDSSESLQQFDMTRFRAVEQGRTAIQVSTVGISGIVEPNGVVRETTEPWTADSRVARVGLRSSLTLATRFTDQIWITCYAVGVALAALALLQLVHSWHTRRTHARG
ncbi:apolipoprotein N-acyltransferase [Actinobaculum sp. 352]|uniref:apolipoprotein N-acyltransferase n=1 Tax=Actinobaculum sp. 352 TaxID=2490946 RepID=UPI000F7F5BC3|nr:apolipoprotein N-acyltransferase [Actinobaculum sp. 352]RTE48384.1 apolipoprotein N-acyltransferase [Actinobaculum sp. 352]